MQPKEEEKEVLNELDKTFIAESPEEKPKPNEMSFAQTSSFSAEKIEESTQKLIQKPKDPMERPIVPQQMIVSPEHIYDKPEFLKKCEQSTYKQRPIRN